MELATAISFADFVDKEYFPHVRATLSPSTTDGYVKMWNTFGNYLSRASLTMRTCDCQSVMRQICADRPHLNKSTLRHVKNFFSGIFSHALRMGFADNANPWKNVSIPSAPEPGETYAYSPQEIEVMLSVLEAPYDLIVLLAATTGLRKSEIRGLQWSDWDATTSTLSVNRAVWRAHMKTTKSRASKAPVPVVPILAARLDERKHLVPCGDKRLMFASTSNTPMDLDNAARRVISPVLAKADVQWHGWHAFRRGLATFLHAQGVDDKTIQAILRHENVSVTQKCYVKTVPESVRKAMDVVKFGEKK